MHDHNRWPCTWPCSRIWQFVTIYVHTCTYVSILSHTWSYMSMYKHVRACVGIYGHTCPHIAKYYCNYMCNQKWQYMTWYDHARPCMWICGHLWPYLLTKPPKKHCFHNGLGDTVFSPFFFLSGTPFFYRFQYVFLFPQWAQNGYHFSPPKPTPEVPKKNVKKTPKAFFF